MQISFGVCIMKLKNKNARVNQNMKILLTKIRHNLKRGKRREDEKEAGKMWSNTVDNSNSDG